MRKIIYAGVFCAALVAANAALACLPCPQTLTLEETVAKADLIIVGKALTSSPQSNKGAIDTSTRIKVEVVLKGALTKDRLDIPTWYGMCPYGLFMNKGERAVIYLRKSADGYYVSDCGPTMHVMRGDIVEMGNRSLTVEEFSAQYLGVE